MRDLPDLLARIERVPPMSTVATRLLQLQSSPNRSLAEVGKIVEVDAGLTAAVLKAANSAAARPIQPVVSVRQAVTQLGERMVLALAVAGCVPGGMGARLDGYESERGALWRHSLRTALAARGLARRCHPPVDADLAFTAGILHDLGKSVLSETLKGEAAQLLAKVDCSDAADFARAEREAYGMCHAEVGEALARRWNLPPALRVGIRYHHEPGLAPEEFRSLAYAIHVADVVAMMAGEGTGADTLCYRMDPGVGTVLKFSRREFEELMCRIGKEMERVPAGQEGP
ncbi:MAG: HDOD domain-containing protein [Deltaproteobacteria bacterium]|nr:HDOD domain-containing protein [Deltaproteobacteria bacterium]